MAFTTTLGDLNSGTVREMKIDRNKRIWNNNDLNAAINDSILEIQKSGNFNWTFNKALDTFDTVITDITSVSDSGGNAQFNHAGLDPSVGTRVNLNGFEVETDYNATGIVSVSSVGSFELEDVEFTATDTGTFSPQEYELPLDFQRMNLVKQRNRTLESTSLVELQIRNSENRSGTPQEYYIRNNKIGLSPIPTSELTITRNYRRRTVKLVDDTDVMELEDDFKRAVELYASYILLSQLDSKNLRRAELKLTRYNQEIAKLNMIYRLIDEGQKFYKTSYRSPSRRGMTRRTRLDTFLNN